LRGYRAGDVDPMVRLDEVCFREAFRFDRITMRRFAGARGAVVVIAEDDVQMAGFVIVHLEGAAAERYGYVVTIDVAPELRGVGLGKVLLREAERQVHAADVGRMGLHVAVDNDPAIRFYERLGYACVGVAKRFYREAGLDGLIYLKELA
jgi:ribosomal protein S18 acetylase RimI-like enzyme